jgi:hypothetical protein
MKEVTNLILQAIEEKIGIINEVVENKFDKDAIKSIVSNVIDGKINRYIVDKTHNLTINSLNDLIQEQIEKIILDEYLITHITVEVKKFIYEFPYSKTIKTYFNNKIKDYLEKYMENYFMEQLADKFLNDVKKVRQEKEKIKNEC